MKDKFPFLANYSYTHKKQKNTRLVLITGFSPPVHLSSDVGDWYYGYMDGVKRKTRFHYLQLHNI